MPADDARVYRPDSGFETGWFSAAGALYSEVIAYRSHIATLFARDFHAAYRGAAFGVFWNFALPLLPITTYILLATLRVFPPRDGIPAAVYISVGATMWFLFAGLIRQPIQIVKQRNNEAMKMSLPLSASIAASFAMLLFDTLVRLALVIGIIVFMGAWPKLTALWLVPIVFAGCIFSLGVGVFLSVLNAVTPDIERIVRIVLQYGIFLSGVLFPVSYMGPLAALEIYNPFTVFISSARDLAFLGVVDQPQALLFWSAGGVVFLIIAARLFYVTERRIRGLA